MRKPGPKTPGEAFQERVKGIDPNSDMGRVMKRAIADNEKVAQAWAEAVVETTGLEG